jgi:hypothetical protein
MDEQPVSESQATSQKPGSCREAGEKPSAKQPLPFGDQMQQLPRAAQQLLTLRAAELVRRHGAEEPMAGGARVSLLDLLAAEGQPGGLRSQPGQHAPDRAVVQGPLVDGRRSRRRLIAGRSSSRAGRLTIGLPVVLHVTAGEIQQGLAGVTLIGEYESRDNR